MKPRLILLIAAIVFAANSFSQSATKAEVLYFKANLSCCQAKACDALEADVEKIVNTKFVSKGVVFKEIKLTDAVHADLVKKHNAKSQTVILVINKGGKQTSKDISKIVADYASDNDKAKLEKDLTASINVSLK